MPNLLSGKKIKKVYKEMWQKIIYFILVLIAIVYIISPIDFIPDFIPIVGWIDDIFVGLIGIIMFFKGIRS